VDVPLAPRPAPGVAEGMKRLSLRPPRAGQGPRRADRLGRRPLPLESALDGTEQIPPPAHINSEGLYEQHISTSRSPIGSTTWDRDLRRLRTKGWPVLSGAGRILGRRGAKARRGGPFHITHVTGPDEENPDVDRRGLHQRPRAHGPPGRRERRGGPRQSAPPRWAKIADGLVVPSIPRAASTPESRATAASWSSRPT